MVVKPESRPVGYWTTLLYHAARGGWFFFVCKGELPMKVKEAMHKGVDWVGPETPITEIAKLMREHDVGAIPIGENDRLIGIVTDRDIVCKGLAKDNFDAKHETACDVMTPGIHCCREDDDLAKAVRHMEALQIRRLPVINKSKRMVGMLSLGDVGYLASSDLLSECVKSVSAHHD
jgi:CBS domain-containing protein